MCSPLNTPTPGPGSDILAYARLPGGLHPARAARAGSQYSHLAFRLTLNSGAVGEVDEVLVPVRRCVSSLVT